MSTSYKIVSDTNKNIRVDSETKDEPSARCKLFRVTPRKYAAGQASPVGHDPTPYAKASNPSQDYGNYC